jgi:hypothetical protein
MKASGIPPARTSWRLVTTKRSERPVSMLRLLLLFVDVLDRWPTRVLPSADR